MSGASNRPGILWTRSSVPRAVLSTVCGETGQAQDRLVLSVAVLSFPKNNPTPHAHKMKPKPAIRYASYSIPSQRNPGYCRPYVDTPDALYSGPELLEKAIPAFIERLQAVANGAPSTRFPIGRATTENKLHWRIPAEL